MVFRRFANHGAMLCVGEPGEFESEGVHPGATPDLRFALFQIALERSRRLKFNNPARHLSTSTASTLAIRKPWPRLI